uniref:Class I chitinase n=1 Tax=Pinus banksiana TaxID=3353 RepID=A0A5C0ZT25_PINBN|nr:class I chitinase [Pinus banksiana]
MAIMITGLPSVSAEDCGQQAGGAVCPRGLCCSKWGWCGNTEAHCGLGCQSQCGGGGSTPTPTPPTPTPTNPTPTPSGQGVASIITEDLFNQLLKYKDDSRCKANGFYSYAAFIAAANAFPGFGTAGDVTTNKRELAAFLGQTSHETTGGWQTAPDGPYAWGYCFKEEQGSPPPVYCQASSQWPCVSGKSYYGRGPIQLTWNYNYGPAGKAIGFDGINNPDIVASDATVSFKTAIWFWMTAQSPKPSCHDVMTGKWTPSGSDSAAGRVPGYGAVTNIVNGGLECGKGTDSRQQDRIGFYQRYCDILGVSYGANLDCNNQTPFGS